VREESIVSRGNTSEVPCIEHVTQRIAASPAAYETRTIKASEAPPCALTGTRHAIGKELSSSETVRAHDAKQNLRVTQSIAAAVPGRVLVQDRLT